MFWMTSYVTSVTGFSAVESMHPSSAVMLTVSNTIANTVGPLSILCQANTATGHWSRKDLSVQER